MKTHWIDRRIMVFFFLAIFITVPSFVAGKTVGEGDQVVFKEEELAQMLAPIALYPDALLAQMFMAATYPLEIIEADRFVKAEPDLKNEALDQALKEQIWDVSVKSLCHFPQVLSSMSEQLDWTKNLGDAFLGQQKEVMDMVQELRAKAKAAGNLTTSEQQKVIVEETIIRIESPSPQVVYVPSYSPLVIYGSWWYPYHPPHMWIHPPYYYRPVARAVAFGAGVAVGIGVHRWAHCNWHHHGIDVDINRTVNFNKNVSISHHRTGNQKWQHNPQHRKSVAYRDRATSHKFGQSGKRATVTRKNARGYSRQGMNKQTRNQIKQQGFDRKGYGTKTGTQRKGYSSKTSPHHKGYSSKTSPHHKSYSSRTGSQHKSKSAFSGYSSRKSTYKSSQRGQSSRKRHSGSGRSRSRGGGRRR